MFVRILDTLINMHHVLRVNPPAELYTEDEHVTYVIDMEVIVGSRTEGRRYKFIDMVEAKEFFADLEEATCQKTMQ